MRLEDLRRLSLRDAGNWPWPIKSVAFLAVVIVIIAAGWGLFWSDQLEALEKSRQQETKLRDEFVAKKQQAVNLELYVQQKKEIEESFGALLRQLPNKSEMDALLIDINQAGLGRGLQFDLFRPAAQENRAEFYAELPIAIKLTGTYHDLGAFASDIAQLPRIVTLNDISISGGGGGLVMDGVARTYRYLDEQELAQQRKGKAAK